MEIEQVLAHHNNFKKSRNKKIEYIVIHYTANNGDTALGNCNYFKNNVIKASAHYFVDEKNIYQSVKDTDTAYHCGAIFYKHPFCRNANSIGIELCSRKDAKGQYYFLTETVYNAAKLTEALAVKYNISVENIIRHYDVTGKNCPEPFVRDVNQWHSFKKMLFNEEASEMTVDEAKRIIKERCGLSESTIQFLYNYRYGDDLLLKIAKAVTHSD